jgi:hypothetical protein
MIAQLEKSSLSIIRRFGHEFLLWRNFMQTCIDQSFDLNPCYLIETELRQLHRRFDHSSTRKLYDLLERADHEMQKSVVKKLIRFCGFCQKHEKSSERFKFILRDDVNFNFSIIVNIMYIENNLILHVIDESRVFKLQDDCKTLAQSTHERYCDCAKSTSIWVHQIIFFTTQIKTL